jgi:hypothetical protein
VQLHLPAFSSARHGQVKGVPVAVASRLSSAKTSKLKLCCSRQGNLQTHFANHTTSSSLLHNLLAAAAADPAVQLLLQTNLAACSIAAVLFTVWIVSDVITNKRCCSAVVCFHGVCLVLAFQDRFKTR